MVTGENNHVWVQKELPGKGQSFISGPRFTSLKQKTRKMILIKLKLVCKLFLFSFYIVYGLHGLFPFMLLLAGELSKATESFRQEMGVHFYASRSTSEVGFYSNTHTHTFTSTSLYLAEHYS